MRSEIHENMQRYGVISLSDEELLAVLLNNDKKLPALLESDYIATDEAQSKVMNIATLPFDELKYKANLTDIEAARIIAGIELGIRIATSRKERRYRIVAPSYAAEFFMPKMQFLQHEEMAVALLNARNEVIGSRVVSRGTLTCSSVDPREVYSYAITNHAASIIIAHNHPSGDPMPSAEDVALTKVMEATGKIIRIPMVDHIIIGHGAYFSFQEDGRLDNDDEI